ncbi:MAG: hypothetical protein M3161_06430 [Actinomycetota bacterium]|nr:hypothetical protein [Actinomycetota bacterium]
MRVLRLVWAGPWTLLGLLLAPFFRARRIVEGVLVCEGAAWPRRVGWGYRAITLGHVVLATETLDDATLRHELAHVAQYERWGASFVPVYLLVSLFQIVRGRHHYRDNPFEIAARRSMRHP